MGFPILLPRPPDEPEDIRKKIMSMFTDPNHLRVEDPGQVEGNPVFIYLDAFCRPEHFAEFLPDYNSLDELKDHYRRGGLGDVKVKKFLNNVIQDELAPIRERRKAWEQRLPDVYDILAKGSKRAKWRQRRMPPAKIFWKSKICTPGSIWTAVLSSP